MGGRRGLAGRVLPLASLLVLFLAGYSGITGLAGKGRPLGQATESYAPHAPIRIENDRDFGPDHGVVGGSGTRSNPYVIEGWDINASGADGIEVADTSAYFLIQGVRVHSGSYYHEGIRLVGLANGRVENTRVSDNLAGIGVASSTNVTVAGNDVSSGEGWGIVVVASRGVAVTANSITGGRYEAIYIKSSKAVAIYHNNFLDPSVRLEENQGPIAWDDGYPAGGNYWAFYPGVDNCSGPRQDDCGGGDGIGDTPYVIDANNTDHYPLMKPMQPGLGSPSQLQVMVRTDKQVYLPSDHVNITVSLSNAGNRTVNLDFGGCQAVLTVEDPTGRVVFNQTTCPAGVSSISLLPGQRKGFRFTWNQKNNSGGPVPPNSYLIRGIIPSYQAQLSASATITVKGPGLAVSPAAFALVLAALGVAVGAVWWLWRRPRTPSGPR